MNPHYVTQYFAAMRSRSSALLTLALLAALPAFASTYEVAQRNPNANDDADGSAARPWKTLAHAAERAAAGDTVLIRDGIYRESVVVKASGTEREPIVFQAAPGAHVVVTGAERLTGWKPAAKGAAIYQVAWDHSFITWSKHMTHPDDEYHRLIGRCEQVFIEGYLLRQVLDAGQLAPGTFFVDVPNHLLLVWDSGGRDLNKIEVEASVRQELFKIEGAYVHLDGIHFRYAANMAQHGAVILAGNHDVMEDCTCECMNSSGATFSAEGLVVRRCVFRDNGQLGFGANGAHEFLFTECLVENNNTKGFDRGWEAGGDKLVLSRHAVLERSRFLRNRGNGIWFDIGNEKCEVRQCLIAENEDSGIFDEISFGLQAHDNVIVANGFASTQGAWGAQAGIAISSSPESLIERNLLVGNREGFDFREQGRTTPRIGKKGEEPVWNRDEVIRHNVIALNRDAQVWGWFDVTDNRPWPAGAAEAAREHLPSGGGLDKTKVEPLALSLEKLRLTFADNIYFAATNERLVEWGVPWRRHRSFGSLEEFQTELRLDRGSRILAPPFRNVNGLDFRLSSEGNEALWNNYPRGRIPGVELDAAGGH